MDAAIKKHVAGRLKLQAGAPHPDPDLLAALAEQSVNAPERDTLLQHMAACSDCRQAFYLAMPDAAETQVAFAPQAKRPRLAVRWATLAASVVILGSVLVTNRGMFTQHPAQVVPGPITSPSAAPQQSPAPTDQPQAAPATPLKYQPPLKHMTAKPRAGLQFDQSGEVHFAAPHASEAAAARSLELKSSPATWGLSVDGSPQRSFDSGKSWQNITVQDGLAFKAINSIGNHVWVGGSAGALYHSADAGQSWDRVRPVASGEKLEANIARIEFTDPQNGTVTAANGQVWSTSDGGQSWRLK